MSSHAFLGRTLINSFSFLLEPLQFKSIAASGTVIRLLGSGTEMEASSKPESALPALSSAAPLGMGPPN